MQTGRIATLVLAVGFGFVLACTVGGGLAVIAETPSLPPIFKAGARVRCDIRPANGTVSAVEGKWVSITVADKDLVRVLQMATPEVWVEPSTSAACWELKAPGQQ